MLEIGFFFKENCYKKTKYERVHNYSWRLWFLVCVAITTSGDSRRETLNRASKCLRAGKIGERWIASVLVSVNVANANKSI